jgi:(p)ppGpp synthase/HD superfamily hydrolase
MFEHDVKSFFINLHDVECNQKYSKKYPYSLHLEAVRATVEKFLYLINDPIEKELVIIGAWGHDSIEDARLSYNDVKQRFGEDAAEIIFLCTEMRGRDRKERKDVVFYEQLSKNDLAVFVKLCDIAANISFSILTNSTMIDRYKKEFPIVLAFLHMEKYSPLFDYIHRLLNVNP